jgi:hypothetical protein
MKKLTISFFLMMLAFSVNAQDNRVNVLQGLESGKPQNQDIKYIARLNKSTRLFGAKDDLTSVIMIIPAGDTVDVTGVDSTYLYVLYQDSEGYILRRHTSLIKSSLPENNIVQQQSNPQQEQPAQQQQISKFSYLENKYGTSMAARLIEGKIWKGMTSDMVQDSWGAPKKINRVINGNVIKEEWIYNNSWLFFQNDTLNEWGPIK